VKKKSTVADQAAHICMLGTAGYFFATNNNGIFFGKVCRNSQLFYSPDDGLNQGFEIVQFIFRKISDKTEIQIAKIMVNRPASRDPPDQKDVFLIDQFKIDFLKKILVSSENN
jgi:hypothetical protein